MKSSLVLFLVALVTVSCTQEAAVRVKRMGSGGQSVPVEITGVPKGTSSSVSFSLSMAATNIRAYKYAVGHADTLECQHEESYSNEIPAEQATDIDLSAIADGTVRMCVLVQRKSGVWESIENARVFDWVKDTLAPTVELAYTGNAFTNQKLITVTAAFSESVPSISEDLISLTNAEFVAISGTDKTFSIQVRAKDSGDVQVQLAANAASDAAGNRWIGQTK